jgi:dATP pyrophosphohydrolase
MPEIVSEIVELSVFSRKNRQVRYLLLRRSKNKNPHPGIWQFITGRVKAHETCLNAALRELREETNLKPKSIWLVPHILQFYDASTDRIHNSPLFTIEAEDPAKLRISAEHDKFAWLPYKQAISRLVWPAQRDGLRITNEYIIMGKEVSRLTRIR